MISTQLDAGSTLEQTWPSPEIRELKRVWLTAQQVMDQVVQEMPVCSYQFATRHSWWVVVQLQDCGSNSNLSGDTFKGTEQQEPSPSQQQDPRLLARPWSQDALTILKQAQPRVVAPFLYDLRLHLNNLHVEQSGTCSINKINTLCMTIIYKVSSYLCILVHQSPELQLHAANSTTTVLRS